MTDKKSKKIAILQSNYIPWKGYFDLIASVDEFIILDNVQFTKNDWRNRNKIKTKDGLLWLTIPVNTSGGFGQHINEVVISKQSWAKKHWRSICQSYSKAPCFKYYADELEQLYKTAESEQLLSKVNRRFIDFMCEKLGINTKISWSTDYPVTSVEKESRVIRLCQAVHGTHYISGPAARAYINPANFDSEGIVLQFANYNNYEPYEQLYPPFEHGVSIVDLLFQKGESACEHMCVGSRTSLVK